MTTGLQNYTKDEAPIAEAIEERLTAMFDARSTDGWRNSFNGAMREQEGTKPHEYVNVQLLKMNDEFRVLIRVIEPGDTARKQLYKDKNGKPLGDKEAQELYKGAKENADRIMGQLEGAHLAMKRDKKPVQFHGDYIVFPSVVEAARAVNNLLPERSLEADKKPIRLGAVGPVTEF
ncbi:MAG: hypothetical protein SFT92_02130 [Rickettsiales bacterium]|nr:hypothetical protein [Rickettsiales bacterium]